MLIRPQEQEIQDFAYSLYEKRGLGQHGFDREDYFMAECSVSFHKHYERACIHLFKGPRPYYLGTSPGQICRFCHLGVPQTTFRTASHAIPHMLGNQVVFAHYECDACNGYFSRTLEDALGKMLAPVRTLLAVRGKKGVPSYKSDSKNARIDFEDGVLKISQTTGERVVEVDAEEGEAKYNQKTQRFAPLVAFKCLTKIALSIMDETDLGYYGDAIRWVCDPDHVSGPSVKGATCLFQLIPGPLPDDHAWVELFRRRDDRFSVPYMTLVVVMKNIVLQIPMHFCERDYRHEGSQLRLFRFPAGCGLGYDYGETQFSTLDLSSPSEMRVSVSTQMTGGKMENTSVKLK